jgi:hypothetical protein
MGRIAVKGVIRAGRVEVDEPVNLHDGSEVTITGDPHGEFVGRPDNGRPPTPEEIAATRAAMDQNEPLEWTDEEQAAWKAERPARKGWEKAHFESTPRSSGGCGNDPIPARYRHRQR